MGRAEESSKTLPYRSKWTPEDKIRIVMESLDTNISMSELCRKYNLTPGKFYQWKERFVEEGRLALSSRKNSTPNEELETENERLKKLIGELTIANDSFKKVLEGRRK